jgi:hypothetical protein
MITVATQTTDPSENERQSSKVHFREIMELNYTRDHAQTVTSPSLQKKPSESPRFQSWDERRVAGIPFWGW